MGWRCRLALAAVAVLTLAGTARAGDFARTGPYVSASGTIASYPGYEDRIEEPLGLLGIQRAIAENTVGFKGRLGYRLHARFALEAEGEVLPAARIVVNDITLAEHRSWAAGINARGFVLTGRFQPWVLVGLGAAGGDREGLLALADFQATGFAARFGGGLDIYATDHIVAVFDLSYVLTPGELEGFDFVSFGWGLQYRF